MQEFKQVSEKEFLEFIKNYPNELVMDVTGICEPPMISYNDFKLGDWPESMVARTWETADRYEVAILDNNITKAPCSKDG